MNLTTVITFSIASAWHQIVQSTVIACDCTLFTQTTWLDEIPNESFNFLVALIALKAEQKLEKDKGR